MKRCCGLLLTLLLALPLQASQAILVLHVVDIAQRPGDLKLAIYQGKDNWLDPQKALLRQVIPIRARQQTLRLPLQVGEYAISIVHDENDNGRMDMKWLPFPHPGEGVGVSNNVQSMGPPSYDEARFEFRQSGQSLSIRMRYHD